MKLLYCSLYYSDIKTGANIRFEELGLELQKITNITFLTKNKIISNQFNNHKFIKTSCLGRFISSLEIYFTFLIFKYDILITDSVPCIPHKNIFYLIHDVRQFTQYRKYQNTILTYLYYANLSIQCNIITVSNFTKNEILKLCSKSKNIIVSPNGIKSNTLIDYATPKDIDILYIATFESRKNHLFLIDVIKSITITHPDIKVILIGRDLGTKQKVINKISELKLKKNISIVNKCSQSEIDRFYLRSKVLVNPSKYEGFGMPLLEALSYKINVVCSDILPFKEICGSHCMYCKLDDVLSFKENIIKALCKNPISEDHLKIFQKNYSWVTIALNLFSILNSHLENNSISNYEI